MDGEWVDGHFITCDSLRAEIQRLKLNDARYRWLRSEEVTTDPKFYPFWNEFNKKLCREEFMDSLIDAEMRAQA